MYCKYCNTEVKDGDRYCSNCGNIIDTTTYQSNLKKLVQDSQSLNVNEEIRLTHLYQKYSNEQLKNIVENSIDYTREAQLVAEKLLRERDENDIENPAEWYYIKRKEKIGPVTKEYIIELVNKSEISYDCLVWKRGMSEWQTVEDSSIAMVRPVYRDNWASILILIIIACSPLFLVIGDFLNYIEFPGFVLRIIYILQFVALFTDWQYLKSFGIKGYWKGIGIILTPVYMFIRAKKTDKRYRWLIVNLITLLITICVLCIQALDLFGATKESNQKINSVVTSKSNKELNFEVDNKKIDFAVQCTKDYLQSVLIGDLVGVQLEYGDALRNTDTGNTTISFSMTEYNEFTKEYSEPYYIEIMIDNNGFKMGYEIKSMYEYLKELGYSIDYTVSYTWDGNYSIIDENESLKPNTGEISMNDANTISLSNGLKITLPNNWLDNYNLYEGNIYYTFTEKQNENAGYEGTLFNISKCYSLDELDNFPESKILGIYYEDDIPTILVVSYPTDVTYNIDNTNLSDAYSVLYDTIEQVKFDTSAMTGFIECDVTNISTIYNSIK